MKNILIVHESGPTNNFTHDWWHLATSFYSRQKLLHVITTLLVVKNDATLGETYDQALNETIEELIGKRISEEDENHPTPTISSYERECIARYLRDSVKALRPYMPDAGTFELVTYVNEPENNKLYLVVRHWSDDEYPNKAFANPCVW